MAPTRSRDELIAEDVRELARLGYAQQLFREMGGFSNFAISFSIISILTGAVLLFGYGLKFAGPIIKIKQLADKEAAQDPEEDGIIPPVFVYTLLAEVAAVQLASASMILVGVLLPRREGRRMVQSVTLVPSLNPGAPGLSLVCTF